MPPPRELGDVPGEIAHPLDLLRDPDPGHDQPQVPRHRGLQRQQPVRVVLSLRPQLVDPHIPADHLLGEPQICVQQRRRGVVHGVPSQPAHRGQLCTELRQVTVKCSPHAVALEERFAVLLPEVLLGVDPATFADLAASVFRPKPPPTVGLDHLHVAQISVAENAAYLRERLAALGVATFAELTADCAGPLEVVARFLAVLDLFRERSVDLEQPEAFGELTVRWGASDLPVPEPDE
jgi:hypothetical protein